MPKKIHLEFIGNGQNGPSVTTTPNGNGADGIEWQRGQRASYSETSWRAGFPALCSLRQDGWEGIGRISKPGLLLKNVSATFRMKFSIG